MPPRSCIAPLLLCLIAVTAGAAAAAPCPVGTKVDLKGGSANGTIAEIGAQAPHVNWFRIVFSWAPKGEWYDPRTWETRLAGTTTACTPPGGPAPAGATPAPRTAAASPAPTTHTPVTAAQAPARQAAPANVQAAGCPFNEPPGSVSRSSRASAALFKRVIFERAAAKVNPASVSAPKKVGITFEEFSEEGSYENTLTSSRFGDKRLHTGAPAGATIYRLKTRELLCELHGDQVRRTVSEGGRECFKNKDGDWVCPTKQQKTMESRLINLK